MMPFLIANIGSTLRDMFKTRDVIVHDGRDLRRFSIAGRTQAAFAGIAGIALCFSAFGAANAAAMAVQMAGVLTPPSSAEAKLAQLQTKLQTMQASVAAIKHATDVRASRVEARQAFIAAVLTGKKPAELAANPPSLDAQTAAIAQDVGARFARVESRQAALAAQVRDVAEQRYQQAIAKYRRVGIAPERLVQASGGVGGPYEPVAVNQSTIEAQADAQFRALFQTWKKLDTVERAAIAIPAAQPVQNVSFTSFFGVRSDPFRGSAAMHAGVDIPGAVGTPIYATADGIVSRAERTGGYGNLVEINHGRGISTRYGHLSRLLVQANTRVVRGQLIALMGSTGRSTGSHLHYEVRIDGQAVNPMPFLQNADYLQTAQTVAKNPGIAVGGDDSGD
ncbi:MAG: M23 family metallopeptidase [Sphingomonas sp.]